MKSQLFALGLTLAVSTVAHADTLVLKDGRRVPGTLVSASAAQIEFEDQSGFWRRVVQVPRGEVARIEFGDGAPSAGQGRGRDDAAAGVPRGMRERQVEVIGNQRWIDTGIEVREGQQLYFAASGEVRWGPRNRKDGAAGERNSPSNKLRPIPDRPAAALIGKIGEREDVFFIGAEKGPFRARESGTLYLGINDDWLEDNTGSLRVNVSY